jgi:lauroyl/myristoyl acyltransferase
MTSSRSRAGSLARAVGLGLLLPGAWLLAYLPTSIGLAMGRRIGDLLWWLLPGRRRVTMDNLRRGLGAEQPPAALRRLGRRSVQHVGMNLVEACRYFLRPTDIMISRVRVEGASSWRQLGAAGRGAWDSPAFRCPS